MFEIINLNDSEFQAAYQLIEDAFPYEERRTLEAQIEVMANKQYQLLAFKQNQQIAGILGVWDCGPFYFIEHFTTHVNFRNQGLGTKLLRVFQNEISKPIVLEVESGNSPLEQSRIAFYQRHGFHLNTREYFQPSYHGDPDKVPLFLMAYPNPLSEDEHAQVSQIIYQCVYQQSIKEGG